MIKTKDFFISYTSVNKEWAEWIAWTLEQSGGYTCILQSWDFVPGQDFMQQMRRAVDASEQIIAILSNDYLESAFAGAELNAAFVKDPLGLKRILIPVRIQKCELGGMLEGRIFIDLVDKEKIIAKRDLLAGIAAARLGRRAEIIEPDFPKPPAFPGQANQTSPAFNIPIIEASKPVNILYLGSDGGAGLDLAGQVKKIKAVLSKSRNPARFDFNAYFEVTTENIFEILNKHCPHIVHFSGKQNGGNVLIRTPSGGVTTIPDNALAGLLQNLGNNVVMAIIDTCQSLRCARSVMETVPFTMGVGDDIYDKDATLFYKIFYTALASGQSIAAAAGQAKASLEFDKNIPKSQIPQLCHKKDFDPKIYHFL